MTYEGLVGGRPTRRRLLQVGGIGMLGLGLPELLHARAPASFAPALRGQEKSCIFIVQYGGASHIDSLDLKPEAPQEIRGPYRPIATNVPGTRIGELLPRLARLADRCCIVRSMTHRNSEHNGGMHMCMTGHSDPVESTPYYGSVMANDDARRGLAGAALLAARQQYQLGLAHLHDARLPLAR